MGGEWGGFKEGVDAGWSPFGVGVRGDGIDVKNVFEDFFLFIYLFIYFFFLSTGRGRPHPLCN